MADAASRIVHPTVLLGDYVIDLGHKRIGVNYYDDYLIPLQDFKLYWEEYVDHNYKQITYSRPLRLAPPVDPLPKQTITVNAPTKIRVDINPWAVNRKSSDK